MGITAVYHVALVTLVSMLAMAAPTWGQNMLDLGPGVAIVVDPAEAGPIHRAVADLQRDLAKVLGKPSPTRDAVGESARPVIVVTSAGASTAGYRDAEVVGDEAHAVFVRNGVIVLQGADVRGTIYAIYTFADRFLGVSPIWCFAEIEPAPRETVAVPADTNLRFDSPAIKWRTWFPNDNRMLDRWLDRSPEHEAALFEMLLRLKYNCLDIDYAFDVPRPNQGLEWARACRDRGIAVATTHLAPLGSRWKSWDHYWTRVRGMDEAPQLTLANHELFDDFWSYFIELAQRENLPMRYGIVFRGDNDKYLTRTFPDAPAYHDYEAQAALVGPMLERELRLLEKVTGRSDHDTRIVLYEETMRQVAQGELELPIVPGMVWTYGNENRSSVPYLDAMIGGAKRGAPVGLYWNLQYTAIGSHHADGQGPWKLETILARLRQDTGGPLAELMINVGNVREFLVTLSAAGEMTWVGTADFDATAWLNRWCARYYGPSVATEAVDLYRRLFNVYWHVRQGELFEGEPISQDSRWLDLKTARAVEYLLDMLESGRFEPNPLSNYHNGAMQIEEIGADSHLDAILQGTRPMVRRLDAIAEQAERLRGQIDPQGQLLWDVSLYDQVRFLRHANAALVALVEAAMQMDAGEDMTAALQEAREQLHAVRRVFAHQDRTARFGTWHDHINKHGFRVAEALDRVEKLLSAPARGEVSR